MAAMPVAVFLCLCVPCFLLQGMRFHGKPWIPLTHFSNGIVKRWHLPHPHHLNPLAPPLPQTALRLEGRSTPAAKRGRAVCPLLPAPLITPLLLLPLSIETLLQLRRRVLWRM